MTDTTEKVTREDNEFEHLIKLLDDEDEGIYRNIKDRFLSYGNDSSKFLKKYLKDENILLKKRANEIISLLNFESIEKKFRKLFLKNEEMFLEDAIFLLASFGYPGVNMNDYKRELDKMSLDIESRIVGINDSPANPGILEVLNTINNYLFFDKGFKGNADHYYEPDNSYINKVLDTKLGIPISLSIIYILISRRLNLPIFGISLPGHFILKYGEAGEEFFIDPFNRGVIVSVKEAEEFIKKIGMSKAEFDNIPYLRSASDKEIVLRTMRNLMEIYNKQGDPVRSEQLEKLMKYFS